MTVSFISDPIKEDIINWSYKRIRDLEELKKLHRGLLSEELPVFECPTCKMKSTSEICPNCNIKNFQYFENGKKVIKKKSMTKEGYEFYHNMIDDAIINFTSLSIEIEKVPSDSGTINCLPIEIKQDLCPYLHRRAKSYSDIGKTKLSTEAENLSQVFKNKVASCTPQGIPSYSWLKRRGFTKKDLIESGNILQLPNGEKIYKGLEME